MKDILSSESIALSQYISKVLSVEEVKMVKVVDRRNASRLIGPEYLIENVYDSLSKELKFSITYRESTTL